MWGTARRQPAGIARDDVFGWWQPKKIASEACQRAAKGAGEGFVTGLIGKV